MVRCPNCSNEVPDESRFCLSCGAAIASGSSAPTVTYQAPKAAARKAPAACAARLVRYDDVAADDGFGVGDRRLVHREVAN